MGTRAPSLPANPLQGPPAHLASSLATVHSSGVFGPGSNGPGPRAFEPPRSAHAVQLPPAGDPCGPGSPNGHLNVTGSLAACVGFGVTWVTETMHAFVPEHVTPLKLFSTVKVVSTLPEPSAVTIFTPAMSQSVSLGLATFLHSLTTRFSCGVKPAACTVTDSPELRPVSGVTVMVCLEAPELVVVEVVVDVVVVVVGGTVVDVVVVVVVVEGAAAFELEPQAAEPSAIATSTGTMSFLMGRSVPTYRSRAVTRSRAQPTHPATCAPSTAATSAQASRSWAVGVPRTTATGATSRHPSPVVITSSAESAPVASEPAWR